MTDPELTRTAAAGQGPTEPAPRRRIGRYTVEKSVGEGGMGVVYAAHDPDLDRRVAVKVLRSASHASSEQRARLLREARAMAKLAHRNVVTVHEVGTDGDIDFVAMELLEGGTLGELHRAAHARGTLSRREVLAQFRQAGLGLAAAHAAGLVHRDFKPHNVLVAGDGRVVVTDFGLARAVGDPAGTARRSGPVTAARADQALDETVDAVTSGATGPHASSAGSPHGFSEVLTRTGSMVGTPAYMPPEQFAGEAGDPRADQFAFCVALWESLCSERPFAGDTIDALWLAVSAGVPASAGRQLPRGLRRVLVRGLSPEPARRWPSMDALLAAIDRADRVRKRVRGWMIALFIIASVNTLAYLFRPSHSARPTCALPASAIDAAWSPARRAALPADVAAVVAPLLDRTRAGWLAAQHAACAAPAPQPAVLACLDEAGQALGALVDAAATSSAARVRSADVAGLVPDLDACRGASPLAVTPPRSPEVAATRRALRRDADALQLAIRGYHIGPDQAKAELARLRTAAAAAGDDVAAAEVELVGATVEEQRGSPDTADAAFTTAELSAERGGNGRVYALSAMGHYAVAVAKRASAEERGALRQRAAVAIARAGGAPSMTSQLDRVDASWSLHENRLDEAVAAAERSLSVEEARGSSRGLADAASLVTEALLRRDGPGDLDRALRVSDAVLATLRRALDDAEPAVIEMVATRAHQLWQRDPRASAALVAPVRDAVDAVAVRMTPWRPSAATRTLTGVVRFPDGRPAPGAEVAVGDGVIADAVTLDPFLYAFGNQEVSYVRADAEGRFRVAAVRHAVAVAASGELRSAVTPVGAGPLTLRLAPTGGVRGAVRFDGPRPATLSLMALQAAPDAAMLVATAPIAADGSFEITGLPPGRYQLALQPQRARASTLRSVTVNVAAGPPGAPVTLVWSAGGGLGLEVIVRGDRSAPVPYAQVVVTPGPFRARTLTELRAVMTTRSEVHVGVPELVSRDAAPPHQPGDLALHLEGLAAGPVTICVIPLSAEVYDPTFGARMNAHDDVLDVVCRSHTLTASPAEQSVVVETPPMRRLPR